MKNYIDSHLMQVTCHSCGGDFSEPVAEICLNHHSSCPYCGRKSELDPAAKQVLASADIALQKFINSLEMSG